MHLRRSGSGEPLLLIHGVGHHLQGWDPVVGHLTDRFEVVATDSPGFGRSAPLPGGAVDLPAYVDAFAALLAEQGLGRPHVAGNSMGGAIALALAQRGLVRSVTAISPFGFQSRGEWAAARAYLSLNHNLPRALRGPVKASTASPLARRALLGVVLARGERLPAPAARALFDDLWASPVMDDVLRAMGDWAFDPAAGRIDVPVTVAWGTKDRLLPTRRQEPRARRALPEARHVPLVGLGHTPMAEDPALVARVVAGTAARSQGQP